MSREKQMLPVSFSIVVLLTIYGIIVRITVISELSLPPTVVLGQYHPEIWGGSCSLLIGGFYVVRFWWRKRKGI
jgi:hypothetical protein